MFSSSSQSIFYKYFFPLCWLYYYFFFLFDLCDMYYLFCLAFRCHSVTNVNNFFSQVGRELLLHGCNTASHCAEEAWRPCFSFGALVHSFFFLVFYNPVSSLFVYQIGPSTLLSPSFVWYYGLLCLVGHTISLLISAPGESDLHKQDS